MEKRSELTGSAASWNQTLSSIPPKKNLNASNYTGGLEAILLTIWIPCQPGMNDFYGRDSEDGKHRMFTYKTWAVGHKHRRQRCADLIDALGYLVMNSSFSTNRPLPTTPLNDWLIWHEVGTTPQKRR